MNLNCKPLKAVLWKNYLLIKKQWVWTILEVTIPFLFFAIFAIGRQNFYNEQNKMIDNVYSGSSPQIFNMKNLTSFLPPKGQWELWHAPNEDSHYKIMDYLAKELNQTNTEILEFESEETLFGELNSNSYRDKIVYIVIFGKEIDERLSYNISIHKDFLEWKTSEFFHTDYEIRNDYNPYLHEGFLALQILINRAYISAIHGDSSLSDISIKLQQIPNIKSSRNERVEFFLLTILPLAVIFTFGIPIFLSQRKQMAYDENSGINNLLRISGIPMWVILFGWVVQKFLLLLFPLLLFALLMASGVFPVIVSYCHWAILLLFLILYILLVILTYLYLARAFKNSTIFYMIGLALWLTTYFIPFFTAEMSRPWKILLSILFSNVALHFGCDILAKHEIAEETLDLAHLFSANEQYDLSMGFILLLLFTNILLSIGLTFTCLKYRNLKIDKDKVRDFTEKMMRFFRHTYRYERRSELLMDDFKNVHKESFVTIRKLIKKHGIHTVLDVPRLDFYKGEITAILGTNGAGKTTLISLLTGMAKQNSGSIIINKSDNIQPLVGYCPQQNVLYDDWTVDENLLFFAKLRSEDPEQSVRDVLNELGLYERKNDLVHCLSTGLRRKTCLGMALVGNPKILILDEPTGGVVMDTSNNIIREVLKKRQNHTVIITTHNPEEAELVADNIFILDNGKVLNEESAVFKELRKGDGYYLSLVVSDLSHANTLKEHLKANCPNLRTLQRVGKKMVFHSSGTKNECYKYLETLEGMKNNYNIETISYNVDILDNVFVKYIMRTANDQNQEHLDHFTEIRSENLPELKNLYENRDYGYKISILRKKLFFMLAKFYWHIPSFLIMIVTFSFAILLTSEGRHYYSYDEPSIKFDLHLYKNTQVLFSGLKQSAIDAISKEKSCNIIRVSDVLNQINNRIRNRSLLLSETNIAAADFIIGEKEADLTIVYSSSAIHSAPISINLAMNIILGLKMNNFSLIQTNIVPLAKHHSNYILKEITYNKIFWLWTIFLPLGMLASLADYIVYPNIEINTQFARLQASTIKRQFFYWNLNIIMDIIHSSLIKLGGLLLYVIFLNTVICKDALLESGEILIFFTILLVYNINQLPFCYYFGSSRRIILCHKIFILFGITFGILPMLLFPIYPDWMRFLAYVPLPQLALCYNLHIFGRKFAENYNWDHMNPLKKHFICRDVAANPCCLADSVECAVHRSYFLNENFGITSNLIYSVSIFLISNLVLFVLFYLKTTYRYQTAISVKTRVLKTRTISTNERNTTENMDRNNFLLESHNLLFKAFDRKINCTFSFLPNSLYGIQGSNGSGKSIFQAILTKECSSFKGDICLTNQHQRISIRNPKYNRKIGFFPGKNKLNYWLTSRDILILAGLSHGYNLEKSSKSANLLLETFGLTSYANRKCYQLSGGNKKVLQTCAAFVGFPDFVIIDDVAKSLDLSRRKALWDFYLAFKDCTKKTVIMGMGRKEKYTDLCDKFLDLDEVENKHSAPGASSFYKITFRMKIVRNEARKDFKFQLEACRDIIKSSFGQTLPNGDNNNSRFLNIKIDSTDVQLQGLVIKADNLKFNHSAYIDDYSIAEILSD